MLGILLKGLMHGRQLAPRRTPKVDPSGHMGEFGENSNPLPMAAYLGRLGLACISLPTLTARHAAT